MPILGLCSSIVHVDLLQPTKLTAFCVVYARLSGFGITGL
jgi:hypothetical protein